MKIALDIVWQGNLLFFNSSSALVGRFSMNMIQFSKVVVLLVAFCVGPTVPASVHSQVVPFQIHGTFFGDLATLEAYGQADGTHLGSCTFVVTQDEESGLFFDTYTAADGSTLTMVRVGIEVVFTPAGGDNPNLFYISGLDYWQIVGGTGRFSNAKSAGAPIISTFATTVPVDIVFGPVSDIPAVYTKEGEFDLGRRK